MERWDAYYRDETLAGFDLVRGEPIPKDMYHIVCEVLIQHEDTSYLLMQRAWDKEGYPGFFEASAGGSVLKGESPLDGAKREVYEETGIVVESLTCINKAIEEPHIFYSYVAIVNCDKTSIQLQSGETIGYKWVDPHALVDFFHSDACINHQQNRYRRYLESVERSLT
ncbi:hypothetical protein AOC36_06335 [Erysipelothrix larvae]|uniref:Nudix hydrolase domain-containing protein n=1 Tax=Erysipelothrix larvae TaxID=1514105 RepID=A0A109UH49_9FIRM|nr:NUDIX hydrolase [Erysipelothrix larvae]AMC93616.1 hypothetical protein AOC36_06335 [Erysipelothrix larvae]